ncbi:hypothetical protein [Rhodococcus baikonurensis]|uniref:Uncharacterized protein n=1 Tax=Rhodococcus baikonurensis TaxID=172041 RepID=A0ABV5XD21_9NOCA
MATTSIPEQRLVELRSDGKVASGVQGGFVDPRVLHRCVEVLDRRGEGWAAAVLGRALDRRSLAVPTRPFLHAGEDHTVVLADAEEDRIAIAHLDVSG